MSGRSQERHGGRRSTPSADRLLLGHGAENFAAGARPAGVQRGPDAACPIATASSADLPATLVSISTRNGLGISCFGEPVPRSNNLLRELNRRRISTPTVTETTAVRR